MSRDDPARRVAAPDRHCSREVFVFSKKATNARRRLAPRLSIAPERARCINGNRAKCCCGSHRRSGVQSVARSRAVQSFGGKRLWSTAESRRGILIAGRGGGPIALIWRSWWYRRASATQAFERQLLSYPHHVPTLCSALVDRVTQTGICGPILSPCLRPQRLWSMPPHGLGMACTWEEQRTLRGRSRSID